MVSDSDRVDTLFFINHPRESRNHQSNSHPPSSFCLCGSYYKLKPQSYVAEAHRAYVSINGLSPTSSSLRSIRSNVWSCAVVLVIALQVASTSSSTTTSSTTTASTKMKLNLGILVAESCDESFITQMKVKAEQAIVDFRHFVELTEGASNPSPIEVNCITYSYCKTRDAISKLDSIFGNETIHAVLGVSTYDLHSSFIPLAEFYGKAYIPVNTFILTLAKTQSVSFAPKFSQRALMLSQVLDTYKWQNLHIIYTNFNYWQNFATYVYFEMTLFDFKVRIGTAVASPVTAEDASKVLLEVGNSKVILLLMDVDDQLSILARASSLSMTTHHTFFSFSKTPYDFKTQSMVGVDPEVMLEARFFNDTSAKNINIFDSLIVIAVSFPPSRNASSNSISSARRRRREARNPLSLSNMAGAALKNVEKMLVDTSLQVAKETTSIFDDSYASSTNRGLKAAKSYYRKYESKQSQRNQAPNSNDVHGYKQFFSNIVSTQSSLNVSVIQGTHFSDPHESLGLKGDYSLAQARRKGSEREETIKGRIDFIPPEHLKGSRDKVKFIPTETSSKSAKWVPPQSLEPRNENSLFFTGEDVEFLAESGSTFMLDLIKASPDLSPLLRSKRDVEKYNVSVADLLAIYDTVFLLAYAVHLQEKRSLTVPFSDDLVASIANFTFPGSSGNFRIDSDQQVSFDFSLYDFNVTAGAMQPRVYYEAVSSTSWKLNKRLRLIWPGGIVLPGDECFKKVPGCNDGLKTSIIAAIVVSILGLMVVLIVAAVFIRRYWVNKEMTKGPNKVILHTEDLVFLLRKDMGKGSRLMKSRVTLLEKDNAPDLIRGSDPNRSMASINELSDYTETARYNGDLVHVKELNIKGFEMRNKLLAFIRLCRDLRHENLNPYVGFLADPFRPSIVMEYCSRGSLHDIIHNDDFKLDWDFKLSLLTDLVRGVRYLHSSPLKFHGHLTSKCCVIDSRFVLKITDYGVSGIMEKCKAVKVFEVRGKIKGEKIMDNLTRWRNSKSPAEQILRSEIFGETWPPTPTDLLWSAPELLRDEFLLQRGSDKGDIYALSIIFQEVALRSEPYSTTGLTPEEIVKKLKKPPPLIRPSVTPQAAPPLFIQIMKQCWSEMPEMRPSVDEVYDQFKKLTGGKKANIVETMFKMLEKYSTDLEELVAERTMQLEEEKKKTDQLLFRMLPPTVAENLKLGKTVEAECFDEVTIYFSDIVGFTTISAMSTPMQVVDLLNDLYSMFDATINDHDVYKVETIGDAYMVVSGLPIRNGNRHAGEIGTLALVLLSQCGKFTIRHMPQVPLRLRIGLHTGSCVAGVVGLTMPRFCLFGDTVNTASRMESSGAAFRIHISHVCKQVLDDLGGYKIEYRGQTELKGKGLHSTYWLVGKEGFDMELPEPPPLNGDNTHGLQSILGDLKIDLPPGLCPSTNNAVSKSSTAPHLASPTSSPKLMDQVHSTTEKGSTNSHSGHLDEAHKLNCTKARTTSVVKADINFVGGGVNRELASHISNKINGSTTVTENGHCQSRHSESNDSGFDSVRKQSQSNDGYNGNDTSNSAKQSSVEEFAIDRQQISKMPSNASSSNASLRESSLATIDGTEDITTVSEV